MPDHWDACLAYNKEQKIIGALPHYQFVKRGIRVTGMPFLTPYMGIHLQYPYGQKLNSRYDFEKSVLDQLISQLPHTPYLQQKFFPDLTYGLPFFGRAIAWTGDTPIIYRCARQSKPSGSRWKARPGPNFSKR